MPQHFSSCSVRQRLLQLKKIQIRDVPCQDRWIWKYTKRGIFSVRSTYHTQITASNMSWKQLRQIPFMPKVRNFLRKALHNKVWVGENLSKKHVAIENVFCLCGNFMKHQNISSWNVTLHGRYGSALLFPSSWTIVVMTLSYLGGNSGQKNFGKG